MGVFVFYTLVLFYCVFLDGFHSAEKVQFANPKADLETLKFVHIIWRHGDRTPSGTIPSDKANPISSWSPGKSGELTKKGMEQHFRLGKYIRVRYDGFLPKKYNKDIVKIRRTDYNRTLWSAKADLSGMFAPKEIRSLSMYLKKGGKTDYEMEMKSKHEDLLLSDAYEACPMVGAEEKKQYTTKEFLKIEKDNEPFLRFLGEKSGLGKIPLPLKDMWRIFDPINSQVAHPKEHVLPKWANETVRTEIFRLYDLKNTFEFNTKLATRLQAGPLYEDILKRMKAVKEGKLKGQKVQIYSAHDISIEGILVVMGTHTRVYPRFATAVFLELHQEKKPGGKHFVRLFHRNETDNDNLLEYAISKCPKPCTIEKMESTRTDLVPKNLEEECKVDLKEKKP